MSANDFEETDEYSIPAGSETTDVSDVQGNEFSLRIFQRDIRFWVNSILVHWYWILLTGLFCATATYLYYTFIKAKEFEARSMLLRVDRDISKDSPMSRIKPMSNEIIIDMIRSRSNMEKVHSLLNSPNISISQLYQMTSIKRKKTRDNLFVITAKAHNPILAANIANYMAEVFVAEYSQTLKDMMMKNFYSFRQNYDKLKREVDEQQREVNDFLAQLGVNSLTDAKSRLTLQISSLETRLLNEQTTQKAADKKIEDLTKRLSETPKELQNGSEVWNEDKKIIEQKEFELSMLRQQFTDANPVITSAQFTLQELKRRQQEKAKQPVVPSKIFYSENPSWRQLQNDILRTHYEASTAAINIENIEILLKNLTERDEKLAHAIPEYDQMSMVLNSKRNRMQELEKTIGAQEILQDSAISDISLYEMALIPQSHLAKKKSLFVAAAFIFSMGFMGFLFLLIETLNLRVRSRQDWESALGIHTIGVLPALRKNNHADFYSSLQNFVEKMRAWGESNQHVILMSSGHSVPDMEELLLKCEGILELRDITILKMKITPSPTEEQCKYLANDFFYGISDELPKTDERNFLYFKMDEMLYLMPPEQEKFTAFRKIMSHYPLIVIMVGELEQDRRLFEILCEASDRIIFGSRYEVESKIQLLMNIRSALKSHKKDDMFGVVYDMPQKIFKEMT